MQSLTEVENRQTKAAIEMPAAFTVKTRKCRACGDAGMVPEERQFTGMETTIVYACPSCSATVEFKSVSQAGLMTALGIMVLAVITAIATGGPGYWSVGNYLLYGFVVLLFSFVPISILLPYWYHPVTGEKTITGHSLDFEDPNFSEGFTDPMQRAIIKFEQHSFWRGFFTPIIFAATFLGIAAAIGMINFYYF